MFVVQDSRALIIRGALLCGFGLVALLWPDTTWITVVRLLGVFALLDAAFTLGLWQLVSGGNPLRKPLAASAVASLLLGGVLLFWPELSASVLTWLVGVWLLIVAGFMLATAGGLRVTGFLDGFLLAAGIATALLGAAMLVRPLAFVKLLALIVGVAALVSGVFILRRALGLRKLGY